MTDKSTKNSTRLNCSCNAYPENETKALIGALTIINVLEAIQKKERCIPLAIGSNYSLQFNDKKTEVIKRCTSKRID